MSDDVQPIDVRKQSRVASRREGSITTVDICHADPERMGPTGRGVDGFVNALKMFPASVLRRLHTHLRPTELNQNV